MKFTEFMETEVHPKAVAEGYILSDPIHYSSGGSSWVIFDRALPTYEDFGKLINLLEKVRASFTPDR